MSAAAGIVHDVDAESLWVVRDRIRFKGELAGTELSVLEVDVPPGSGTPPHVHSSPEIFRVLDGEVTFGLIDGDSPSSVVAGVGTVVTVPSRLPHSYRNDSRRPARLLVVVERSMVRFFRELGKAEAPPAGPPSETEIAEVMAACVRHDIRILGGAPA
ncbi:MAG: cupin domain-containing protein [Thermoanaerobaculia bacterium]